MKGVDLNVDMAKSHYNVTGLCFVQTQLLLQVRGIIERPYTCGVICVRCAGEVSL